MGGNGTRGAKSRATNGMMGRRIIHHPIPGPLPSAREVTTLVDGKPIRAKRTHGRGLLAARAPTNSVTSSGSALQAPSCLTC